MNVSCCCWFHSSLPQLPRMFSNAKSEACSHAPATFPTGSPLTSLAKEASLTSLLLSPSARKTIDRNEHFYYHCQLFAILHAWFNLEDSANLWPWVSCTLINMWYIQYLLFPSYALPFTTCWPVVVNELVISSGSLKVCLSIFFVLDIRITNWIHRHQPLHMVWNGNRVGYLTQCNWSRHWHIYNRFIHCWWRSESSENQNQKLSVHHFLWGSCDLWYHPSHRYVEYDRAIWSRCIRSQCRNQST